MDLRKLGLLVNFGAIQDKLTAYVKAIFSEKYSAVTIDVQPNPDVVTVLEERVDLLCKKSQEKLTGDLDFAILQGYENSESIDKISERVKEIFTGTDFEIERIVRTEILHASNAGSYEAKRDMGANWKVWRAADDDRTADDSKRLDGQVQPIDKLFVDPGTGETCMYPPNRPMCRCSVDYYIDKPDVKIKHKMEYIK